MDSNSNFSINPTSPTRNSLYNSSATSIIPEKDLNVIRTLSIKFNGLTFVSGIIIPEYKESTSDEVENDSISKKNDLYGFTEGKIDMGLSKVFKLEELLSNLKSNWEDVKTKNNLNKQNIELMELNKLKFIRNTSELQRMCDHSLTFLRNLENQTKMIEEYIFPYQQYNVMCHKLQSDRFVYNINEVSSCFEVIDNSIIFFQEHELKHNDYYIEGYKKLRLRLCNMMKIFMRNILYDCASRNNIENDTPENINSQQMLTPNNSGDNKSSDQNMSLYYTRLRAKGKSFNEYLKLLIQRLYTTHQNEVYRYTIKEMEDMYINYRLSDECFGIKVFANSQSDEKYINKNSQNCLTLNLKNYTKLALNYCKYEWIAYNSFFNYDGIKNNGSECKFTELSRFNYYNQIKGKSVGCEDSNSCKDLNFEFLIEKVGDEYCSRFSAHVKEICFDPEILKESINYLSHDILNISNELYHTIYFPDSYLSAFLHYVVKLQNVLIEQLLFTTEIFIKKNIDEYELKMDELNYPEILYDYNVDKKLIKSLQSLSVSTNNRENSDEDVHSKTENDLNTDGMNNSKIKESSNVINDKYLCETEVLTNLSFPPNTIRLQTSSDFDDNNCDDDYFGYGKDQTGSYNALHLDGDNKDINTFKVNIGSHPIVKNSLLALSYIYCVIPNSTFIYLNKLIIQKCYDKLLSARDYIGNNLYKDDKISRLYHCNLFMIRNLLYLKYELIVVCKQSYMRESDEVELIEDIDDLLQLNKDKILNSNHTGLDKSPVLNPVSSSVKALLESINNIIDVSVYNHLEYLINNVCSNISLPLTKIVLQVHPEIQENDISELKCTSHNYIKDSIDSFWKNLKLHVNDYIIKYMDIYLAIAGKQEMEALFSQIFDLINNFQSERDTDPKETPSIESCKRSGSFTKYFSESEFEKSHLNNIISSAIPSSLYIFLAIKKLLLEGVIYEFDHVLNKRLGIEGNIIENELGWRLPEILGFLESAGVKLSKYQ